MAMTMTRGLVYIILLLLVVGCKQTEYVPVVSTQTDSVYITKIERDSVLVRDSVIMQDKGDTVFVERWKTVYKSKVLTDTFYVEKRDSIPYPVKVVVEKRYIPEWMWWFTLFGVACALLVGLKVVRKVGTIR